MYVKEIVLYGIKKTDIEGKYNKQVQEIRDLVDQISIDDVSLHIPEKGPINRDGELTPWKLRSYFEKKALENDWIECTAYVENNGGRKLYMRMLGFLKNNISVNLSLHRDSLNRWLYTSTPIAYKNGLVDLPVMLLPTSEFNQLLIRQPISLKEEYERAVSELKALEPLSHVHPFVLIGISPSPCDITWIEIQSEKGVAENKIIINRSIEFPPHFRQAGLGILNYFSEVVREKYPEVGVNIRIEQQGSNVRMIVEAEDGSREVIEKALEEYELVVTGKSSPETLFDNKAKILELKSELRIAEARIETQKELIEYQRDDIRELKQLFNSSLTKNLIPGITLNVSPAITVNAIQSNTLNNIIELGEALEDVQTLIERNDTPEMSIVLNDLYESLENQKNNATQDEIFNSGAMKKLKRFLDEANETGSKTKDFIDKMNGGIEVIKCLGQKYNTIAEWCGAPQIPKVFL